MSVYKYRLLGGLILTLAFFLRSFNLNWDAHTHLHPDERFLTMVLTSVSLPSSLTQYLDTSASPFNPHNAGYPFFVYGTFPLLLTKILAVLTRRDTYDSLVLVGRLLSALSDTGTVLLLIFITRRLVNRSASLLAGFFYAVSVLPIQLSHFFAVDTFLVFFLVLSFYFLVLLFYSPRRFIFYFALTGASFAAAIACKISAAVFAPVLGLGFLFWFLRYRNFAKILPAGLVFIAFFYGILRFFYPYLFISFFQFNPAVLDNWRQLSLLGRPDSLFPPAVQWLNLSSGYSLINLSLVGLGLPLAVSGIMSLLYALYHWRRHPLLTLISAWIVGLFVYQVLQFTQPVRYFYPLYPFLAILCGLFVSYITSFWSKALILVLILIWPVSYLSVYARPHSRVAASDWINRYLPSGSRLACEHWDDCLPVGGNPKFSTIELSLFDLDSPAKWQLLSQKLSQTDYLLLTSNRLFGSIPAAPDKFPFTSRYYQLLFSGQLGFKPVAQFTSRPNLPFPLIKSCLTLPFVSYGFVSRAIQDCPLPGLTFVDDYVDETFTVYDHPKVIIFQNTGRFSPSFLYSLITSSQ